jgi:MarR family transcriptional regulator, lower aerobic nicotinate degradation pathway regulator
MLSDHEELTPVKVISTYLSLSLTVTVQVNISGVSTEAALRRLTADPGFLLSRVGAAIRAGFKDVLARRGIRPLQYMLLLVLEANSAASQQQLCVAAGVDSGNMVELLDGLEALQYASRARDPRDRRRYVVSITPAGRSVLAELRQAVEEYNASFFTPLAEAEREQLASSLGKLFATTAEGQPRTPAGESLGP